MSEQTTPCCDVVCRGKGTPGCAMQTTPRTVEEAARVIALLDDAIARVPRIGGAGAIYEAELLDVLRAAREVLAARMPSVEEVAEVLCEPRHRAVPPPGWPVRPAAPHCPACAAKAARVVALRGAL